MCTFKSFYWANYMQKHIKVHVIFGKIHANLIYKQFKIN